MKTNQNIRKKEEFRAFIKLIESGVVCHWVAIAEVLGVNKDTVSEWKKTPKARLAIARGIARTTKKMEEPVFM